MKDVELDRIGRVVSQEMENIMSSEKGYSWRASKLEMVMLYNVIVSADSDAYILDTHKEWKQHHELGNSDC